MANVLNRGLEISEFRLQPYNYIYFQTNILGKGMKFPYS